MIRFLSIQDFAVVDTLELELRPGLTVLTGETGAGKSVVIGALASLVGGRSSGDLVRTGETLARVQATVEDESGRDMIIRREIAASGSGLPLVASPSHYAFTGRRIGAPTELLGGIGGCARGPLEVGACTRDGRLNLVVRVDRQGVDERLGFGAIEAVTCGDEEGRDADLPVGRSGGR